jgi:hypothetical protein
MGIAASLPGASAQAAEPTKLQCIHANEEGQDLRRDGHFGAALDRFESCSVQSCPSSVRKDCSTRLEETREAFPKIELRITDANGTTLERATLEVDGQIRQGMAINVEPGDHNIKVTSDGFGSSAKQLHLKDGEKLHDTIVLRPQTTAPTKTASSQSGGQSWFGSSQKTLGVVAGAVGGAAIATGGILGLLAKSNYDSAVTACGGDPSICRNAGAVRDGTNAHSMLAVSTIVMVVGAVFLAGGAVLFFTAPAGPSTPSAFSVAPSSAW